MVPLIRPTKSCEPYKSCFLRLTHRWFTTHYYWLTADLPLTTTDSPLIHQPLLTQAIIALTTAIESTKSISSGSSSGCSSSSSSSSSISSSSNISSSSSSSSNISNGSPAQDFGYDVQNSQREFAGAVKRRDKEIVAGLDRILDIVACLHNRAICRIQLGDNEVLSLLLSLLHAHTHTLTRTFFFSFVCLALRKLTL